MKINPQLEKVQSCRHADPLLSPILTKSNPNFNFLTSGSMHALGGGLTWPVSIPTLKLIAQTFFSLFFLNEWTMDRQAKSSEAANYPTHDSATASVGIIRYSEKKVH